MNVHPLGFTGIPRALAAACFALGGYTAVAELAITQQAYLKASNTPNAFDFGVSAVSGDTVVVGAQREPSNSSYEGAAYVFVRNGTNWIQQAYLKASNPGEDLFGSSVAISGDTIVIGATDEDSNATGVNGDQNNNSATNSGAAYIFVRKSSIFGPVWSQQAYLKASNTGSGDWFGGNVAICGETVVIGAGQEDSGATGVNGNQSNSNAPGSGAVYVFVRNGTAWSQQAYLKASNTGVDDFFSQVAISGDTIAVGAAGEDSNSAGVNGNQQNNSASDSGAVYVFVRRGTTWSQQVYLKASNPGGPTPGDFPAVFGDSFGSSVGVSGDTIAVAAWGEDSNATGANGIQSNNSALNSGAAYVFVRKSSIFGPVWSQQAYLKASNTAAGDDFGSSVAVSGETVVVGARLEGSNATGVNGNQSDNSARNSGAAYVFVRSGATWSQRAYLKASNTGTGNYFGASVAVSDDTLVVGAPREDSSTTGVNSNPNNGGGEYGAAYVFTGVAPPLPPRLAIEHSAGGVRLSWPLSASSWVLEQNDGLELPASWSPISPPYDSDATGYFLTVPAPVDRQFFRLRRP